MIEFPPTSHGKRKPNKVSPTKKVNHRFRSQYFLRDSPVIAPGSRIDIYDHISNEGNVSCFLVAEGLELQSTTVRKNAYRADLKVSYTEQFVVSVENQYLTTARNILNLPRLTTCVVPSDSKKPSPIFANKNNPAIRRTVPPNFCACLSSTLRFYKD